MESKQTPKSRWRLLIGQVIASNRAVRENSYAWKLMSDFSTTEEASFPGLSEYAFAVNPLSSLSSSMMSPKSRWRILKHVVVATLRFQAALGRHLLSGSSSYSTIIQSSLPSLSTDVRRLSPSEASAYSVSQRKPPSPFYDPFLFDDPFPSPSPVSIDDLAQSPEWITHEVDPPYDFSSSPSRWRVVKHVVLATLRLQSIVRGRRWQSRLMKMAPSMQLVTSLPNLPDLELKSIIETDEISGKVYRVVHRQTGQTYALKVFPDDASQRQQISGEVQILKELDHPNLVKCYDVVFGDAGVSFLLLEPLDRGSPNFTTESDLVSFAYQLLLGLSFLHRNKIWHGDITPSNIFVDHAGKVKLLYLGNIFSKAPAFSAEIGAIHDRFSWDIWSVGLCILKLSRDFSEDVPAAELKQIQSLNLDLSLSYMDTSLNEGALLWKQSTELLSFLSACMQTDVIKRWTAEQLLHHPFFAQFPLEKELQLQLPPLKKEVQLPHTQL